MNPSVVLFDVNETLLDLGALDNEFERVFGTAAARTEWFAQVVQSALLSVATDRYRDFGEVGGAALAMTARRHGIALDDGDRRAILAGMRTLPAHPEVPAALERMAGAGLRMGALTNSPPDTARAQLAHAGLDGHFERILSVESAQRLKPAAAVYRGAAAAFGVGAADVRLVAAHAWDVVGAMAAGCSAAFVARPGMVLDPLFDAPDVVEADLAGVAERLIERMPDDRRR